MQTTFSVKDIASELGKDPKSTRHLLRSIERELNTRFPGHTEKGYSFTKKQLVSTIEIVDKILTKREEECDPRCTHSKQDSCDCHCGGANHGIHAAK